MRRREERRRVSRLYDAVLGVHKRERKRQLSDVSGSQAGGSGSRAGGSRAERANSGTGGVGAAGEEVEVALVGVRVEVSKVGLAQHEGGR